MSFSPSVPTLISSSNVFVVGNTASGNALSVQQVGAGNVATFRTTTGATALFVSSSGNVGVGTTNPGATLQVSGNIYALNGITVGTGGPTIPNNQGGFIGWNRAGSIVNGALAFLNQQGGGSGGWEFINYNNSNQITANCAFLSSAGGLTLGTYSNVSVAPNGGLICPGNVGIGTATVSAGLQYWGGASSTTTNGAPGTGGVIIGSDATNGSPGDYSPVLHFRQSWYTQGQGSVTTGAIAGYKTVGSGSFGGGLAFLYCANGATSLSQGMTLTDLGRVGINTTSPGNLLQVAGTGATISVGGSAGWSNVVQLGNVSYNQYGSVSAYPANRFTVLTSGLPGVNDLQNANGGLYVASQGLRLTGQRLTWAATSYESAIEIDGGRSALGGINNGQIRFYTANSQRAVIDEGGNVGIGTASPGYTLDVNGTANITGLRLSGVAGGTTTGNGAYPMATSTSGGIGWGVLATYAATATGVLTANWTNIMTQGTLSGVKAAYITFRMSGQGVGIWAVMEYNYSGYPDIITPIYKPAGYDMRLSGGYIQIYQNSGGTTNCDIVVTRIST